MSLFVGVLPVETALRVWDILWYEGSKTIFRISLTIFKLCIDSPGFQNKQASGTEENQQIELFQFMQGFPKQILDPNLLIDHCFKKLAVMDLAHYLKVKLINVVISFQGRDKRCI